MKKTNPAKQRSERILDSLENLAFCSANDAARLVLHGGELSAEEIEKLDLLCVAELLRSKDGALEVKLCDRIKVLQLLLDYLRQEAPAENAFYGALETAAKSVNDAVAL